MQDEDWDDGFLANLFEAEADALRRRTVRESTSYVPYTCTEACAFSEHLSADHSLLVLTVPRSVALPGTARLTVRARGQLRRTSGRGCYDTRGQSLEVPRRDSCAAAEGIAEQRHAWCPIGHRSALVPQQRFSRRRLGLRGRLYAGAGWPSWV